MSSCSRAAVPREDSACSRGVRAGASVGFGKAGEGSHEDQEQEYPGLREPCRGLVHNRFVHDLFLFWRRLSSCARSLCAFLYRASLSPASSLVDTYSSYSSSSRNSRAPFAFSSPIPQSRSDRSISTGVQARVLRFNLSPTRPFRLRESSPKYSLSSGW